MPAAMPYEVQRVFDAMQDNAVKQGWELDLRPVYCRQDTDDEKQPWLLGSNYEDGSQIFLVYFPTDLHWEYRVRGTQKPMPGQLDEALANAECWFTG